MLQDVINYVRFFFEEAKESHNETDDVILKSCLVYQFLHNRHFKTHLTIDSIPELNNDEIGLIGPGNGRLTRFFEKNLGNIDIIHSHSILHDAFGRFYDHHQLDRGYLYVINEKRTAKFMKKSPIFGQITGLLYCCYHRIYI